MKKIMLAAHKMTKELVEKYGVDYQAQLCLCISYLIENKEENEMTMEQWFNGLSEKEISRMKDRSELFPNPGETLKQWNERKKAKYNQILEEEYKKNLEEIVKINEKKEREQKIKIEEENKYQECLVKGIGTIELYESNKYRQWMAEIIDLDKQFGFKRKFINPSIDNGNYKTYELQEGRIYNYLNKGEQYFVKVINSKLVSLTKTEVKELIK